MIHPGKLSDDVLIHQGFNRVTGDLMIVLMELLTESGRYPPGITGAAEKINNSFFQMISPRF
jgi:hypothetical protein